MAEKYQQQENKAFDKRKTMKCKDKKKIYENNKLKTRNPISLRQNWRRLGPTLFVVLLKKKTYEQRIIIINKSFTVDINIYQKYLF